MKRFLLAIGAAFIVIVIGAALGRLAHADLDYLVGWFACMAFMSILYPNHSPERNEG